MIYETLLGNDFQRLHPKLQQRYRLSLQEPFQATGMMQVIHSGPRYLRPMYQLFTKNRFYFQKVASWFPLRYLIHAVLMTTRKRKYIGNGPFTSLRQLANLMQK